MNRNMERGLRRQAIDAYRDKQIQDAKLISERQLERKQQIEKALNDNAAVTVRRVLKHELLRGEVMEVHYGTPAGLTEPTLGYSYLSLVIGGLKFKLTLPVATPGGRLSIKSSKSGSYFEIQSLADLGRLLEHGDVTDGF